VGYGALAPPVGLLGAEPPPAVSEPSLALLSPVPPPAPELACGVLAFSAELPPELDFSLLAPSDSLELDLSSLDAPPELVEELEPLFAVEVVAVVDVEVVEVASLSAWVLAGGVISGVLCGATSAVLPLPPQAASVRLDRSTAAPARTAARDLTGRAAPSGGHTWDSR
jgi:hypothetical protein